jgi:WD40 repeat protein
MRLQLIQKVENASEDSIWTVTWVPGKRILVTGSVDENVLIWEETGSAEEVSISHVHTLVRLFLLD